MIVPKHCSIQKKAHRTESNSKLSVKNELNKSSLDSTINRDKKNVKMKQPTIYVCYLCVSEVVACIVFAPCVGLNALTKPIRFNTIMTL